MDKEIADKLFKYQDGELYWKIRVGMKTKMDKPISCLDKDGYKLVRYQGKNYKVHRIIFLMEHGYLPKMVDHIDGNPANNKISNLRASTNQTNQYNQKLCKRNTSGIKGISINKGAYEVRMRVNGALKYFGRFNDLEFASLLADEVRNKYHKEFACHG